MKSSTRRMRWFMITLFIVLMALCLGLSMFFIACKGGSADDEEEKENPSGEPTVTVTAVTISGPEDNELEVGMTLELTATVTTEEGTTYTGSVTWESSSAAVATVSGTGTTATVTGVAEGEANITATASGVKSETYTVNVVPVTSSEPVYDYNAEESFIVPLAGSFEGLSNEKFTAGDAIADNTLFTLTADVGMEYYGGAQNNEDTYGNVKTLTFTDMNGESHNPDQGIMMTEKFEANQTIDDIISITAKEDATVYVYVVFTNTSYNSNKTGKVFYSVNGGAKSGEETLSSRTTIWSYGKQGIALSEGDVLTIGAEDSNGDAANFWFFGAEAKAKEGGNTGSTGSESGGSSGGVEFEEDPNYEWVDTYADLETALAMAGGSGNSYKTATDLEVGKFTFGTGVYFENSNSNFTNDGVYCVNNQQKNIYFTVSGTYNNISFKAVNGSSGTGTITIYTESGTALKSWFTDGTVIIDYATDTGSYLAPGTYYIGSVNSFRFGNICLSEYLEKSAVTGMTVKTTTVDFLKGRSVTGIDLGISATLDYENGRHDSINLSDLDIVVPTTLSVGENTVTVTYNYTDDTGTSTPYTESVTIYVYYVVSIEVTTVSMEYTNTYITHNLQQVFLVGDTFNYDYIVVTATCSCGVTGIDNMEFILKEGEYNVATPTLTTAGAQTVTVSVDLGQTEGDAKTDTYTIHVVEITSSTDRAKVQVYNASDTTNTATYTADTTTGIISVSTINDAIKLLELMGATDAERKYIYVGAGEYWEKIYIDMPNLSLIGSNTVATDVNGQMIASRSEETVIVYDAMNGVLDPSGTTTFSTVGSATVTVSSNATGFIGANITFRNYWNTNALYNEALKITSSTQADAAYINADRSYFYNVTFTGYHDTLEAENGRQYYDHCYIEGRTDYIFGNTATCYFDGCIIHTIGAGSTTNGGYVMAIKGGTDSAHVDYGYVFNGCSFITDLEKYYKTDDGGAAEDAEDAAGNGENEEEDDFQYTVEGTVSVARTWSGSNMHIAILNSSFDEGFSTTAYGTSGKNPRYTAMSGDAPTPAYLVEYNNSGEGAITSSIDGTCTVLTETEAANYTISNIFSTTNGGISYDIEWDPTSITIITVSVEDESGNAVATVYATGSITVSDLVEAVNARLADAQVYGVYSATTFDESALVTEDIATTTTVYVKLEEKDMTVPESVSYDFSGAEYGSITESGWLDYIYFDVQEGGSFSSNSYGWYQLQSATLTVKLSAGSSIEFEVYSENSITVDKEENVTVTVTDAVSGESNWFYKYTVSEATELTFGAAENAQLYIRLIIITVPVVYEIGDVIRFDDVDSGDSSYNVSYGETGIFKGVTIDATALTGSGTAFRNNGNSFQVAVGVVFEIQSVPGATVTITFYGSGYEFRYTAETDENGLIKITVTEVDDSGGYVKTIQIIENTGEVIYDVGDSISFVGIDGNILDTQNSTSGVFSYEGIEIDGTNGSFRNNSNSLYVSVGTVIRIQSVPYATAEVEYFNGYGGNQTVETDESGLITITFTAADNGQIYITGINIVVKPYEIGDVIDLVTGNEQGSFQINGTTGSYEGIEVDATNDGKFFDNGNSFQVNTNTVLKIQSVAGATAEITYYSGNAEEAATIVEADEDGVITITFTTNTYITAITIVAAEDDTDDVEN